MALIVVCPSCKQKLTFPDQFAGREVQCPGCMSDVKVTAENRVPDAPAKPAPRPASAPPAAKTPPAATKPTAPTQSVRPQQPAPVKKPVAPEASSIQRRPAPAAKKPAAVVRAIDDDEVDTPSGGGGKKFLVALLILILLGGAGVGGYFLYQNMNKEDGKGGPIVSADKDKDKDTKEKDSKDKDAKDKDAKDKDSKDKDAKDKGGKEPTKPVVFAAKPGEEYPATGKVPLDIHLKDIATDAEGKFAYVLCDDSSVKKVDLASKTVSEAVPPHARKKLGIGTFALSPDGKFIARALDSYGIDVINLATKEQNHVWAAKEIYGRVAFSPDSKTLYAQVFGKLNALDIDGRKQIYTAADPMGHELIVTTFGLSPDGKHLFGSGNNSDLFVVDAATGKTVHHEQFEKGGLRSSQSNIVFSADGKRVIGVWQGKLENWHVPSLKHRPPIDVTMGKPFSAFANGAIFLNGGERVAASLNSGKVYLHDVLTGQRRAVLKGIGGFAINGIASGQGDKLLVAIHGQEVLFWDLDAIPLDAPDTTLASIPDSTEVAKIFGGIETPKGTGKEPPKDRKFTVRLHKEKQLTSVGKAPPFIAGHAARGFDTALLLTEAGQLVLWDNGTASTFELAGGPAYVSGFHPDRTDLYTLTADAKPRMDEAGRFIMESPEICHYSLEQVLNGKSEKTLKPTAKARLKGKVGQLEFGDKGLMYLDVTDPIKPTLNRFETEDFKKFRKIDAPAGTIYVRPGRDDSWYFLTNDGTIHLYDPIRSTFVNRKNTGIKPYDMDFFTFSGSRAGQWGLSGVSIPYSGDAKDEFRPGFPDNLKVTSTREGLCAIAVGPESTDVFLNPLSSDGDNGVVHGVSTQGPSRGKAVALRNFVLLDNGDVLAIAKKGDKVATLDPKSTDPGPGMGGKIDIGPSKDYRLTHVGKTQPFIEGFVLLDQVMLLTEGPKQLVIWEPSKTTAYSLSEGTAYISAFEKYAQRLITLSAAEKPPTDEYGRFVLDNPTIARYDANAALIGTAKPGVPMRPKDKGMLKGKVVQLECMGNTLVYLDIADPAKPKLRWIDPAIFSTVREVTAPAGTVAFKITEMNNWHCVTREGALHVYSTLKNAWIAEEKVRITPHALEATPKGVTFVAGTRDGTPGILRITEVGKTKIPELFISGLPPKLNLKNGEPGFLFALESGAAGATLIGLHTGATEDHLSLLHGMSKGGASNGRFVIGKKFLLIDNGDIFALSKFDDKVAMLDPKGLDPFMPKGKDPFFPKGKDPFPGKFPLPPVGGGEPINLLGKVEPFIGGWIDPENKSAVLVHKGILKVYSYPEMKPKATWKTVGASQRVVFDKEKGLMYALSPNLKVDNASWRGASQLRVFEVRDLMLDKVKPTITKDVINPVQTIPLPGFCTHLFLSPDGEAMYLLENKDYKTARALKLSMPKGELLGEAPLHQYSDAMVMTSDGKTLYAITHSAPRTSAKAGALTGSVQVVDTGSMKAETINVTIDPNDVEATTDGIVFLSSFGPAKDAVIQVLDMSNKASPVVATWKGVPPALCLKLDEPSRRLFVRSTKNNPSLVAGLPLPDMYPDSEIPRVPWGNGQAATTRGEFLITPDGRYLLCESGQVYLIGTPDPFGGIGGVGGFPAP